MKKLIALVFIAFSVAGLARYEEREMVRVKAQSAQAAFSKAQAMAQEINDDTWNRTKFSYLRKCNPKPSQDRGFNRKAWVWSSSVSVNHVTNVYTAILNVKCDD